MALPRLEGAVGAVLVVDAVLLDPAQMATVLRQPVQLEVWLVQRGADDGFRQTSVRLGVATLGLDGRVQLRSTIPSTIATRLSKFGLAVPAPLIAGEYVIRGIADLAIPVHVTTDAAAPAVSNTRPGPIDASRRILGEHDLAGVVFGTRDDAAEAALTSRLGAPTASTDWQSACPGEARRVSWGSLTVMFRREDAKADGAFASYEYGSIVPGSADGSAGFATARDIRIGTTIEELGAVDDAAEIHTGYDGFDATNWTVRGSELVASLDRDFLEPGAKVVRIAAPRTATLQVC